MMDRQLFLRRRWAIIAFLGLSACVRYRPMPINPEAIHAQLQPPDMADLCILAREIKHPLLHPLEMKPDQGLSPDEAAVLAVIANPSLRAARDRRALADAQLLQAGLLPNPQLSASLEPVTGGATAGTFTGYGYGMSWDVSAVIARRAKTDSARANRDSVDLEVAWQEWQVAQAARLSVYRLLSLRERVSLARDMKDRFAANLRQVRQAVQEGLMTELDLSAAETTGNQAQADLADLLKQVREQHLELNQMLGFPPQTPVALRQGVVLPSRLDLPPEQDIVADLEQRRLDLMALRKGYESQEAALRVAILEQFPKINLNQWLQCHHRSVMFLLISFALAGLAGVPALPVSLFPKVDFPRVVVNIRCGDRPAGQMAIQITLPAMAAGFIGLWMAGTEMNITAMMGMTMVVGIVTEVSIIYYSEFTALAGCAELTVRLIEAGKNRMRPIAMATLAAMLALMPLALGIGQGAAMQRPLAVAIISGLAVQLFLVLTILPSLITILKTSKDNGIKEGRL